MAPDFGRMLDPSGMSDDELYDVILEKFNEQPELDTGWITISVQDGFVTLSGRVGNDGQVRITENILQDVLGIQSFSNELVVDELHRGHAPQAADDAVVADLEVDEQHGEEGDKTSTDTAEHLVQDLEGQTYGTHNMQSAIQEGMPYVPPDRPTPDGYGSNEQH